MNFLRLQDDLLSILFEDDDILAINKPYGFNAHTNDSKLEHSEFIQDGLIEIFEKQLGRKLHIVHRLDQTTTGVMIFGKSVESAKKYAEFFFGRQVKKTYLFVTKSISKENSFVIDQMIVHKAKELDAKTELRFLKRSKFFELWQANPLTGRNHQIRIHAKAAKLSILGDPKYEGANYPFLCLHNHKIEFPNAITITAEPPLYFQDLTLLEDLIMAESIFQIDRRQRLFADRHDAHCFRLIHNKNNAKTSGFTLDQMGSRLVLNWYFDSWTATDSTRFKKLSSYLKKPIAVRLLANPNSKENKNFTLSADSFIAPPEDQWMAAESGIKFQLRTDSGSSLGLFTNQRLQRQWILREAKHKSVLTLFSHTGTASLAAALGGAQQVISVDHSKAALNWSKENFQLNLLDPSSYSFFCRDSITFIQQSVNKKNLYDLIICDVPSFQRREKGFFKIENDFLDFLTNTLQCLNLSGQILLSTNFDGFYIDSVRQIISKSLSSLQLNAEISCLLPSLDYELPDEKANLKSFLIQLKN